MENWKYLFSSHFTPEFICYEKKFTSLKVACHDSRSFEACQAPNSFILIYFPKQPTNLQGVSCCSFISSWKSCGVILWWSNAYLRICYGFESQKQVSLWNSFQYHSVFCSELVSFWIISHIDISSSCTAFLSSCCCGLFSVLTFCIYVYNISGKASHLAGLWRMDQELVVIIMCR